MGAGGVVSAGQLWAYLNLNISNFKNNLDVAKSEANTLAGVVLNNSQAVQGLGVAFTAAGAAITAGLTAAALAAKDYNLSVANIATLMPRSTSEIMRMKDELQEIGVKYAKIPGEMAAGAYEIVSAFGASADTTKKLEINTMGAAAGMSTVKEAIKLTSAVTKGFGDISVEATQKVMDLSFLTVKLGQTTFPELAASVGKVVPLMEAMGGTQEEMFAVLATGTGVTGTAAEVTTQLASAIGGLIKPTGQMREALGKVAEKHLGLQGANAKTIVSQLGLIGTLKAVLKETAGADRALGEMQSTIKKLGYTSAAAMVQQLGLEGATNQLMNSSGKYTEVLGGLMRRKEGMILLLSLVGGQADTFKKKFEAMQNPLHATRDALGEITDGVYKTGFKMDQAKVKMTVAAQKIGDAVLPILSKLVTTVASIVEAVGDFVKAHPSISTAIIAIAGAFGALFVTVGPILIFLPQMINGFIALKTIMAGVSLSSTTSLVPALAAVAIKLGAIAVVAATAYAAFKGGQWLADKLGITGLIASISKAEMEVENFKSQTRAFEIEGGELGLMAMTAHVRALGKSLGVTSLDIKEHAAAIKQNKGEYEKLNPEVKKLVDMYVHIQKVDIISDLRALGTKLGETSLRVSDHARKIKESREEYEKLSPVMQKAVDKWALVGMSIKKTISITESVEYRTQKNYDNILGVLEKANKAIMESTLSAHKFKIWLLDEEYAKEMQLLGENKATRMEIQIVERAHALAVAKIRADAAKKAEKEQKEQEMKKIASIKKIADEAAKAIQKEKDQQRIHHEFLKGLEGMRHDMIVENIRKLVGERSAELKRLEFWHQDQKNLLVQRLNDEKITKEQYEEEVYQLEKLYAEKRKNISEDLKVVKIKGIDEWFQSVSYTLTNWAEKVNAATSIVGGFFDALKEGKLNNLETWYNSEKEKIEKNITDQGEREAALSGLDAQYDAKKAAIEKKAAKREKAIQIASAIANTAVAVTKAISALPWPFNLPLIAFAVATGAAQIAAIGGAWTGGGADDYAPGDTGVGGGNYGEGPGGEGSPGKKWTKGGGNTPGYATGTKEEFIKPPELFWVGEEGPELFEFDDKSGEMRITPVKSGVSFKNGISSLSPFHGELNSNKWENKEGNRGVDFKGGVGIIADIVRPIIETAGDKMEELSRPAGNMGVSTKNQFAQLPKPTLYSPIKKEESQKGTEIEKKKKAELVIKVEGMPPIQILDATGLEEVAMYQIGPILEKAVKMGIVNFMREA